MKECECSYVDLMPKAFSKFPLKEMFQIVSNHCLHQIQMFSFCGLKLV